MAEGKQFELFTEASTARGDLDALVNQLLNIVDVKDEDLTGFWPEI